MSLQDANLHWRYTDGDIVAPWYTLPALQWLKSQPTQDWKVFEYGAGYSTIWWRLNCAKALSIDHNKAWAQAMSCLFIPEKKYYVEACVKLAEIYFNEKDEFERVDPDYDLIIVDGIHREECVEFCLPFIKPGGYLIIDNYGSEDYDIARTEGILAGWECVIHKQPNHSSWCTAVFKKPE